MDYVDVAAARNMKGLRLVCVAGSPSAWSLAARSIFELRNVPYTPVAQQGGMANEDLVAWTRHRNAPIALYKDEPPRVRWLEIVHLAERLGSGPSLIPADMDERMAMVGLTSEMAEPYGYAWNMRLLTFRNMQAMMGDGVLASPMFKDYGFAPEAVDQALPKVRAFLDMLTRRIKAQRAAGSDYLIGDALSPADIYWAYFSLFVDVMTPEQNPLPEQMRPLWEAAPQIVGPTDPVLVEQRDIIFAKHLKLPLDY